jgi:hypothetical protein
MTRPNEMNSRTKLIASVWILVASAMTATWYFAKQASTARVASNALAGRIADAKDQEVRQRGRLSSAEATRAKLQSEAAATAIVEKKSLPKPSARPDWLELLRTDPKVQARSLAYERNRTKMVYAPLFRILALTPEQILKFEDNVMRLREGQMDLASTIALKGLAQHDPAVETIGAQQQSDYESAQKDLLGEAGYQQLKTYDEDWPARSVVSNIVGGATVAGLPLTTDQTKQLTDLVVQASRTSTKAQGGDYFDGRINWTDIDDRASSFLTPAQVAFMKSAEITGPTGEGTRFQDRLNSLITKGDNEDAAAAARATER